MDCKWSSGLHRSQLSNAQLQAILRPQLIPTYDVSCKGTADRFGLVTLYNIEKPPTTKKQEYISGNNAYMIYLQSYKHVQRV